MEGIGVKVWKSDFCTRGMEIVGWRGSLRREVSLEKREGGSELILLSHK